MADITAETTQIRQAVLGKDVRESLAVGLETINAEAENTTQRQTTLETNMAAAEQVRQTAEAGRATAEEGRVIAEGDRVTEHDQMVSEVDAIKTAYDAATKANLSVEVSNARGTFPTLPDRLNDVDAHLAESVYLQEEEPTATNQSTLWFAVESEVNFSGGGVAIENAQTSPTPPNSYYWFEPV